VLDLLIFYNLVIIQESASTPLRMYIGRLLLFRFIGWDSFVKELLGTPVSFSQTTFDRSVLYPQNFPANQS